MLTPNIELHADTIDGLKRLLALYITPHVNLNGDDGNSLSRRFIEAYDAAKALERALAACHPHGRNFQTLNNPQAALVLSSDAHWVARESVAAIADYLSNLAAAIADQGYYNPPHRLEAADAN